MDKEHNEEVTNTEETEQDTQPEVNEEKEEKTFTQEELDNIVEKRLAREAKKREEKVRQAEELAKLSAEERAKKEFELEQEEFERQKQEFHQVQMEHQTAMELDQRGLPISFAKYVIGDDAESTQESINEFEKLWESELERRRIESMKGTTPTQGGNAPAITHSEFKRMGYKERIELKNDNEELYNKLTKGND